MPVGDLHDPGDARPLAHPNFVDNLVMNLVGLLGSVLAFVTGAATPFRNAWTMNALHRYPNDPLAPATLAAAAVKGVYDLGELTDEARLSGMSPERFDVLVKATGNPPGPNELVDQWRRGLIDDAELERGIRQGYLRTEWLGFFRNLRHLPLSAIQYLQGAVEGHMDLAEAKRIADGLGMTDRDAQLVYDTLGNPPGTQELLHLWNRGEITEAEVDQGIRESHYKNKWIPAIKAFRRYLPPPRTVTTLLAHGAITAERADVLFRANGMTDEDARAYVASALHTKTASHKELAAATVENLYVEHMLSRVQAVDDLGRIGYQANEANLILDLSDRKARAKIQAQTITQVRHLYVAKRIDEPGARAELAKLNLDTEHQNDLLQLWSLERGVSTKSLSIGQLNAAYKKDLITRETFVARAVDLGYTRDDAEILADIDHPPEATP